MKWLPVLCCLFCAFGCKSDPEPQGSAKALLGETTVASVEEERPNVLVAAAESTPSEKSHPAFEQPKPKVYSKPGNISFDLVGVKLGMTVDQVKAALGAPRYDERWEAFVPTTARFMTAYPKRMLAKNAKPIHDESTIYLDYLSANSGNNRDGTQVVNVKFAKQPTPDKAIKISRLVTYKPKTSAEAILLAAYEKTLTDKYGPWDEKKQNPSTRDGTDYAWTFGGARCALTATTMDRTIDPKLCGTSLLITLRVMNDHTRTPGAVGSASFNLENPGATQINIQANQELAKTLQAKWIADQQGQAAAQGNKPSL